MYRNRKYQCPHCGKTFANSRRDDNGQCFQEYTDYGPSPFIFDIHSATGNNTTFRTSIWTGKHLQLTVMCIPVGGEIGAEIHHDLDQFVRIEEGNGMVLFGTGPNCFNYNIPVDSDYAVIIPAGTYHNIKNTGNCPLKVYSIYAPPAHPFNTVHETKADADAEHH